MEPGRQRIDIPAALAESHRKYFGGAGQRWIADLPDLAHRCLDRWRLRLDGAPTFGAVALVLPVLRDDQTPAALKLQPVDDETRGEAMALQQWTGLGAVRLLELEPTSGSMLLERLDPDRSLASLHSDLTGIEIISGLLRRLHTVRAPSGLRRLSDVASTMIDQIRPTVDRLSDPVERRLLHTCAATTRELLSEPVPDRLLHWDLHYDNVLAAYPFEQHDPWRAIDPKPLAGDPGFDLLPALWNRWDDVVTSGNVPRAVLHRFDLMVDLVDVEPDRAAGWTLARVLQNALWDLEKFGQTRLNPAQRSIAESLLGRRNRR